MVNWAELGVGPVAESTQVACTDPLPGSVAATLTCTLTLAGAASTLAARPLKATLERLEMVTILVCGKPTVRTVERLGELKAMPTSVKEPCGAGLFTPGRAAAYCNSPTSPSSGAKLTVALPVAPVVNGMDRLVPLL